MADLKWIKLYVNTFNTSRKIKQIEQMTSGDTILIIWFKLLCMAGDINDGGAIYVTPDVPYSDQGLANELKKPLKVVKKALETFELYGMIERVNGIIRLVSWEKHQNAEKQMDLREYNRLAKRRSREKKNDDVNDNVNDNVNDKSLTSQPCQDVEEEEEEKEKEYSSILSLSELAKNDVKKRFVIGEIGRGAVKLNDEQLDSLLNELTEEEFVKYVNLVADLESRGKRYTKKTHYRAILDMALKDRKTVRSNVKEHQKGSFDIDEFFDAAVERSLGGGS